jgi:hypothetical protein
LRLSSAVPGVGVEVVAWIAVHHAAIPARLGPVTLNPGGVAAVEGVLVGPRLEQELLAEAVHAGAAICGWPREQCSMRLAWGCFVHFIAPCLRLS